MTHIRLQQLGTAAVCYRLGGVSEGVVRVWQVEEFYHVTVADLEQQLAALEEQLRMMIGSPRKRPAGEAHIIEAMPVGPHRGGERAACRAVPCGGRRGL
jgi:hypothetical protein